MIQQDEELQTFLAAYDKCFQDKDIEALKQFYPQEDNELIYFDNHKNNDTYNVKDHLRLLTDFFQNGKKTESGQVEELITENMRIFKTEQAACICSLIRYKSFPVPAVRATFYLERHGGAWKIKHVHCSFEPNV